MPGPWCLRAATVCCHAVIVLRIARKESAGNWQETGRKVRRSGRKAGGTLERQRATSERSPRPSRRPGCLRRSHVRAQGAQGHSEIVSDSLLRRRNTSLTPEAIVGLAHLRAQLGPRVGARVHLRKGWPPCLLRRLGSRRCGLRRLPPALRPWWRCPGSALQVAPEPLGRLVGPQRLLGCRRGPPPGVVLWPHGCRAIADRIFVRRDRPDRGVDSSSGLVLIPRSSGATPAL